jgi:type IV pilus assembly protein PilE
MGAPPRQCKNVMDERRHHMPRSVCAAFTQIRASRFCAFCVDLVRMFCRGITLFELLVTLLLVSIIAALALPGYRGYMVRVNRSEALTALLQLQDAEEKFYLRHDAYTNNVVDPAPAGLGISSSSVSRKYLLSVALAADGQSYIATATPAPGSGQEADHDCFAFSIDARGRRAVSGTRDAVFCWR